jgi:hypothetical protein
LDSQAHCHFNIKNNKNFAKAILRHQPDYGDFPSKLSPEEVIDQLIEDKLKTGDNRSDSNIFARLVSTPLDEAAKSNPLENIVILVDALDEASSGIDGIVSLLVRNTSLPHNV